VKKKRVALKRYMSLTVGLCMRGMPRQRRIRAQMAGVTVFAPKHKLDDQKTVFFKF
jgi:hypothetical protein